MFIRAADNGSGTVRTKRGYLSEQHNLSEEVVNNLRKSGLLVKRGKHLFAIDSVYFVANEGPWMAQRKGISREIELPQYQIIIDTVLREDVIVKERVVEKKYPHIRKKNA